MNLDTISNYAGLVLAIAALVLHFVAPRTKTTLDDTAAEVVDDLAGKLGK